MASKYDVAIREARTRYNEAMEDAAADVLLIVEEFGKPLQTVCKDIAGEGWNALRVRAQRLHKSAGQTPEERARAAQKRTRAADEQKIRRYAKEDPDFVIQAVTKVVPEAAQATHKVRLQAAKSLLRDPEIAADVVEDKTARRTIVKAEAQRPTRRETPEKTRARERDERESAAQVDAEYGPLLGAVVGLNAIPLVAIGAEFLEGLEEVNGEEGTIGEDVARALDSIIRRATEEVEVLKFRSGQMEGVR